MDFKYLGKKTDVENAKQYILGVDIASSNDATIQNLICSACKSVIETSIYDSTLPGFGFKIPDKCPKCGIIIRRVIWHEVQ